MNIRIENTNLDTDATFVIDNYSQLLREKGFATEVKKVSTGAKGGDAILELVVTFGSWAAYNMAWELLKYSVSKLGRLPKTSATVSVGTKKVDLNALPTEISREDSEAKEA